MAVTDDVQNMVRQGMSEQEMVGELKRQGVSDREISDAMSQNQIKSAVSASGGPQGMPNVPSPMQGSQGSPMQQGPGAPPLPSMPDRVQEVDRMSQGGYSQQGSPMPQGDYQPQGMQDYSQYDSGYDPNYSGGEYSAPQGYEGMQPSMMSEQGAPQQGGTMEYGDSGGDYGGAYQDYGYPSYRPYQEAMSSDVITEISEQVVTEKLSHLQDKLEKVLDVRTVLEAKIEGLDERLKRMEKMIDQIQLSILHKVGEYMADVKNVRKELVETQKTFIAAKKKHKHKEHKN